MSNNYPIGRLELRKRNLFNRMLKKEPSVNAYVELNNLIAESDSLLSINSNYINQISTKYSINLLKKFRNELESMYKQFLEHFLEDKLLTDNEIRSLSHLKNLFGLSDKRIEAINNEVASRLYRNEVDNAIKDGHLTDKEKDFLTKLQGNIKLPKEIAEEIYKTTAKERVKRCIDDAVADGKISPVEEKEIEAISKSLGIEVAYDSHTQRELDKMRLVWQIENGEIPVITAPINLQKNETCYFSQGAVWKEQKRITQRIRYGGPTMRIKIAKGVYWRMGDLGVKTSTSEEWVTKDSGSLILTNKRLIFMGNHKTSTIRLSNILNFEAFRNGIEIYKGSGKNPFFEFSQNVDIFVLIFSRALSES